MPWNRKNYPPDWEQIRAAILVRATNRCEICKRPNGEQVWVFKNGWWEDAAMELYDTAGKIVNDYEPDDELCMVKTVLTISHTDHDIKNNTDDNLRALCQRCHLCHDAKQHAANAAATREWKKYANSLFPETAEIQVTCHT